MDYRLHKSNPLMRQHIITCGRASILEQVGYPHPMWAGKAVISISDTLAELQQMQHRSYLMANASLCLRFVDDEEGFTLEQALDIIRFVKAHPFRSFVIHCFLGVSRSVAVAKWVCEHLNIEDEELTTATHYNTHVYNTLVNANAQLNEGIL